MKVLAAMLSFIAVVCPVWAAADAVIEDMPQASFARAEKTNNFAFTGSGAGLAMTGPVIAGAASGIRMNTSGLVDYSANIESPGAGD
jgi:hypothetical protein